jgi:hypothetical protein
MIRLVEGVNGRIDKPCNVTQEHESIHNATSMSSLVQEEKQMTMMDTLVKTTIGKVDRLRNHRTISVSVRESWTLHFPWSSGNVTK